MKDKEPHFGQIRLEIGILYLSGDSSRKLVQEAADQRGQAGAVNLRVISI